MKGRAAERVNIYLLADSEITYVAALLCQPAGGYTAINALAELFALIRHRQRVQGTEHELLLFGVTFLDVENSALHGA